MKEITKRAYAKVNLSLDVLSRRKDGYHEVCMVMQSISLCDYVSIKVQPLNKTGKTGGTEDGYHKTDGAEGEGHKITLSTNDDKIPKDESNIAFKAAAAILAEYDKMKKDELADKKSNELLGLKVPLCVQIHIEKRIPVSAGLAGGSSNAAAVLTGLNELLGLKVPLDRLMQTGKSLGADVPFCIMGGCALAEGIGEKLTPLEAVDMNLLLCKPDIEVSTAQVYKSLDLSQIQDHPDTAALVEALAASAHPRKQQNRTRPKPDGTRLEPQIFANMINVLETVTLKKHPQVVKTKELLKKTGAAHVLMSGSGPTVFAVYTDKTAWRAAYEKMKEINRETFMVKTLV